MKIPQPLSWEQRHNGASPLPGGYSSYLQSFSSICERVERGSVSFEDLVNWAREGFDISETSARLELLFLLNSGLMREIDGIVSVDKRIRQWMQGGGDEIPISIIHSRIKFVGEMLSELEEPKSVEALRKAAVRYGLDWQTNTQIDNRRGWLQSAKLIERRENHLRLTGAGQRLLKRLENYAPSRSSEQSSVSIGRQQAEETNSQASATQASSAADRLASEILAASTKSNDHRKFERLVRDAFALMGFVAKHLGEKGRTDVLLTAQLSKIDSYCIAVDTKTNAAGSLRDDKVDWATMREHREKHAADYSLLVAPNPGGDRLFNRAREFKVAVLSADQLADLCRRHARAPLNLVDYEKLFATPGEVDLTVVDDRTEHLVSLQQLVSLLSRELSQKTDRFGRMTARDVQLAFGEQARGVSLEDIQRLLEMLAHPLIGVVFGFGENGQSGQMTEYVLANTRDCCAQRIRLLADSVANSEYKS